ncbi:MAG: DUF2330 domain-containing protein [Deltaproteobacteria bacterium]|nr:DUF2330 domain-containing protein [Deltaproteobacteria bacterium]
MSPLLFAVLAPSAHAFCGTYVGSADSTVTNTDSQVVIVRQGRTTVLTLANDFQGDASEFGLVIPVPRTVQVTDVSVVDRGVIDAIDAFTAPRLVSYDCSDFVYYWDGDEWVGYNSGSSTGCGGTSTSYSAEYNAADAGAADTASDPAGAFLGTVEAERFTAGEYELALVDADGSTGLEAWLAGNGFVMNEAAAPLLAEAIDQRAKFLVARVTGVDTTQPDTWLSPIQIRYTAENLVLPIRLGATSSSGVQDLLVYGITSSADGALAVSNYPQVTVDEECILDGTTGDDFGAQYEALYSAEHDEQAGGKAGWSMEYNAYNGKCDPCPESGGTLDEATLTTLGFTGGLSDSVVTRIHMRGSPETITEDLAFYTSGWTGFQQQRYIQAADEMYAYYPVCNEGMVEGAEGCPEPEGEPDDVPVSTGDDDDEGSSSSICASALALPLATLLLAAARRRRR